MNSARIPAARNRKCALVLSMVSRPVSPADHGTAIHSEHGRYVARCQQFRRPGFVEAELVEQIVDVVEVKRVSGRCPPGLRT